ncbi:hypothetical protein QWJ90_11795 [Microbacterium oryzae]|nr:hypothetical protein [Microbacterium oryzae]
MFGIASPLLAVGTDEVTTAATWAASGSSELRVGVTSGAAGGGTRIVDYAELITYPRLLQSAERTTVVASLQAHYSVV